MPRASEEPGALSAQSFIGIIHLIGLPNVVRNPLPSESGLHAKQRLIEAGLEIFGAFNLEGATTRQLAERAGVNQAAIPYYFGGKEGLYLAVIEHVITHKASRVRPVLLQ